MLEVQGVSLSLGGLTILDDLSFAVGRGEVCALIGPNGAGKTSLFNCVSGVYRPSAGRISIAGHDVTGLKPHERARRGVARTFQNLGLFPSLSVRANAMAGAHTRLHARLLPEMLAAPWARAEERALQEEADLVLDALDLGAVADTAVTALPFGTQKRVEIARALMARPALLMLDEPANGLSDGEVDELAHVVRGIRDRYDLSILLVEHHIGFVTGLSQHVVVMDVGRQIAAGTPAAVTTDPNVVRAYLGDPL
ncbi:MAG: ABC transporter ATP-binding protein [Nocardioidaceae bacterium]|nr:ABC transporter ATP-binding protein [Nocardioidaceae bacterium]